MNTVDFSPYLAPGRYIDSDAPSVVAYAKEHSAGAQDQRDAALRLYTAIRDGIAYDPYVDLGDPINYQASGVLAAGRAFCVGKSCLLAACARALGIPARPGFADVRNHLTSPRFYEKVKTDTFLWHSYAELHLSGRWVKATPAFDRALCERLGLKTLEFDGETDSLLQPFDQSGRQHMEYLKQRGTYIDVPFDAIAADFVTYYPSLMSGHGLSGDFQQEAVAQTLTK